MNIKLAGCETGGKLTKSWRSSIESITEAISTVRHTKQVSYGANTSYPESADIAGCCISTHHLHIPSIQESIPATTATMYCYNCYYYCVNIFLSTSESSSSQTAELIVKCHTILEDLSTDTDVSGIQYWKGF